jgi:hypothetical protein
MQRLPSRESAVVSACLLATVGLALAACGSSGGGHSTTPTTPATSSSPAASTSAAAEPTTGSAAVAAIKANWATFFSAKTSLSRRVALLQDGPMLRAAIIANKSNSLASTASAKVTSVKLTGANQAPVVYTIYVGGQPALKNKKGVAIYQNGVWKVGLVSFCGLLQLENAGSTTGLPSACKG